MTESVLIRHCVSLFVRIEVANNVDAKLVALLRLADVGELAQARDVFDQRHAVLDEKVSGLVGSLDSLVLRYVVVLLFGSFHWLIFSSLVLLEVSDVGDGLLAAADDHHFAALQDILPVVRLHRCVSLLAQVFLILQVVDFVVAEAQTVHLKAADAGGSLSLPL